MKSINIFLFFFRKGQELNILKEPIKGKFSVIIYSCHLKPSELAFFLRAQFSIQLHKMLIDLIWFTKAI